MNFINKENLLLEKDVVSRESIEKRMKGGGLNSFSKCELFVWNLEMFLQLQKILGDKIILKGGAATQFYLPVSYQRTSIDIDMICLDVMSYKERAKRANFVARSVVKSERETRAIIDEQLRKVGFEADTIRICYSKGVRPEKGKNIAIAEWPTNSKVCRRGYADYALFVGEQLMAVVEAKAEDKSVYNVIDDHARESPKVCVNLRTDVR